MKYKRTTEEGATIFYQAEMIPIKKQEKKKKSSSKKEKKRKEKKEEKLLSKPKVTLIKKYDPVKAVLKGAHEGKLVSEGETGYFKDEYNKEKMKFLGGYSL